MNAKTKKKILALTAAGKSQDEIARRLHVHRNTVYRVRKSLGLEVPRFGARIPVLTPEQECRIFILLCAGVGTGRIADKLDIAQSRVRAFAESHRFGRRRLWDGIAEEMREKIIGEIREHQDHASAIAEKYGLSYKVTLGIAHQVLHCPKFRPGSKGAGLPLSSNLPQKNPPHGSLSA
jgi:hypothetical protein